MAQGDMILDVADVVKLEQAIAAKGTPLATLMERAGTAIAREASAYLRENKIANPYVVVLAGSGNNGGDGWVAANLLAQEGCETFLITPKAADGISAEPAHSTARTIMKNLPEALKVLINPTEEEVTCLLEGADVVIDALLGTGFSGQTVREPMARWISLLNSGYDSKPFVIAADVPSGVSAQTGEAATPHVFADRTVTMIVAKPGLVTAAAKPFVGTLVVDNLGIDLKEFLPV